MLKKSLPFQAAAKGMREAVSGFVFSIYALVMMLSSPIFGKLVSSLSFYMYIKLLYITFEKHTNIKTTTHLRMGYFHAI